MRGGLYFLMDNSVLEYIEEKFKPESLEPVFISESDLNIPEKDMYLLNTKLTYDLVDYELNGTDLSHTYMQRVYCGNMHDSDASIKFMKKLNVKIITADNMGTLKGSKILSEKISVPENKSYGKYLSNKVSNMIRKFVRGDVTPGIIKDIKTYSNTMTIRYTIGAVHICTKYQKDLKSNEFFIAIPYIASYEAN